jgi:hypothetical protein
VHVYDRVYSLDLADIDDDDRCAMVNMVLYGNEIDT